MKKNYRIKRILIIVLVINLNFFFFERQSLAGTQSPSKEQIDSYYDGQLLGEALFDDCYAAMGIISGISSFDTPSFQEVPEKKLITFEVTNWIWGKQTSDPRRDFIFLSEPKEHKEPFGPWAAWKGVRVAVGSKLFLIWWGEQSKQRLEYRKPGWIVFACENNQRMKETAEIINVHREYVESKTNLESICKKYINENSSPIMIGYFLSYLRKAGLSEADESGKIACFILKTKFKNIEESIFIGDVFLEIRSLCQLSSMSQENCAQLIEELVAFACSTDHFISKHALRSLSHMSKNPFLKIKLDITPFLTRERRDVLSERYRLFISTGEITKSKVLEIQLGLDAQPIPDLGHSQLKHRSQVNYH